MKRVRIYLLNLGPSGQKKGGAPWPAGAEVREWENDGVYLRVKVSHHSFDEVGEGDLIPYASWGE